MFEVLPSSSEQVADKLVVVVYENDCILLRQVGQHNKHAFIRF